MNNPQPCHFADRLLHAIEETGSPICIGLDPVYERLPECLHHHDDSKLSDYSSGISVFIPPPPSILEAIRVFCTDILDAVADLAPVVKFQSACFERYRAPGVELLYELIGEAQQRGFVVILDAKRGDIGISAAHYAAGVFLADGGGKGSSVEGYFDGDSVPDALTINAYLGMDTVEPFVVEGRGLFALVRTSNPGSDAVQGVVTEDGSTVAERIASALDEVAGKYVGECGYSSIGAVVGATKAGEMARLRSLLPRSIFLVPGYGAQGGKADDVRACFDDAGRGAIVSASRSVIYAFDPDDVNWVEKVRLAAQTFHDDIKALRH